MKAIAKFGKVAVVLFICGLLLTAPSWPIIYTAPQSESHLRYFKSHSELVLWLARDDTDSYEYVPDTFDCDDFALTLQKHALEDGYIVSCEYIEHNGDAHMLNTAVIGNKVYKIYPQTDEACLYYYLD